MQDKTCTHHKLGNSEHDITATATTVLTPFRTRSAKNIINKSKFKIKKEYVAAKTFLKSKFPQESDKIKFLRQGLKTQFRSSFAYS